MILVTKTCDQTRQRGYSLSTCKVFLALDTLCFRPSFLAILYIIWVGSNTNDIFLSTVFYLPVCVCVCVCACIY